MHGTRVVHFIQVLRFGSISSQTQMSMRGLKKIARTYHVDKIDTKRAVPCIDVRRSRDGQERREMR